MSEPTREEMLDELDCCIHNASVLFGIDKRSRFVLDAIINLIKHGPEVDGAFIAMLRDRMMAIRIKEYFAPNPRKAIADEIRNEFIKNGVTVKEEK